MVLVGEIAKEWILTEQVMRYLLFWPAEDFLTVLARIQPRIGVLDVTEIDHGLRVRLVHEHRVGRRGKNREAIAMPDQALDNGSFIARGRAITPQPGSFQMGSRDGQNVSPPFPRRKPGESMRRIGRRMRAP